MSRMSDLLENAYDIIDEASSEDVYDADAVAMLDSLLGIINESRRLAMRIVGEASDDVVITDRARCTWNAHIQGALNDDHDFLGGSMNTMQDTINEIAGGDE